MNDLRSKINIVVNKKKESVQASLPQETRSQFSDSLVKSYFGPKRFPTQDGVNMKIIFLIDKYNSKSYNNNFDTENGL